MFSTEILIFLVYFRVIYSVILFYFYKAKLCQICILFVHHLASVAFFIGFFGGPLCYMGAQIKHYLGFDDALDAFGVHAIGGIIGGISVGFFATDQVASPFGFGDNAGIAIKGVYYGGVTAGGHQLAIQLVGISFAIGWSFVWTYCILQIIDKTIGLRVSEEAEEVGLDSSIHGEVVGTQMKMKSDYSFEQTNEINVGVPGHTTGVKAFDLVA